MYSRFSTFFCLLLLIGSCNVSYAFGWLGGDHIPKEVHIGELIIVEGCGGEYCTRFCDDTIMIQLPGLGPSTSYWFWFVNNDRIIDDDGFREEFRTENPIGLKTSKPFTFYSDLDGPTPTTKYGAGVIAKPIEQKIVIRDRGEYVVEEVRNPSKPPKVGDKVDTPIYVGEGSMIVRSNGRWIGFSGLDIDGCFRTGDCYDLKLNVIREAKVETWVKVEVEGVVGFTPEGGFLQGCYE